MYRISNLGLSIAQLLLFLRLECVYALPLFEPRSSSGSSLLDTILSELSSLNATYTPYLNSSLLADLLPTGGPYTITQNSPNPLTRAAAINVVRLNFLYGPPVAGGPSFPTGALGLAKVANDLANVQLELNPELTNTGLDAAKGTADISKVCNL